MAGGVVSAAAAGDEVPPVRSMNVIEVAFSAATALLEPAATAATMSENRRCRRDNPRFPILDVRIPITGAGGPLRYIFRLAPGRATSARFRSPHKCRVP